MFDSELSKDVASRKITRRLFVAGGVSAAAGLAIFSMRQPAVVEAGGAGKGTPGEVTIVNFSDDGKSLGKQTVPKVIKTDAEWKQQLTPNAFDIARRADTEMPYSGNLLNEHAKEFFAASAASLRSSTHRRNSIPALAGPASGHPSPAKMSPRLRIPPLAWIAPR